MNRFCRYLIWTLLSLMAGSVAAQTAPTLAGTIIVLNKSGNDASVIDLGSGQLLATIAIGQGPHELLTTSDGRWAVATNYSGGNSLSIIDVENLLVARTIDLSEYSRPHGLVLLPGEAQVMVTSEGSRSLVIVDIHDGTIVRSIDTAPNAAHMVAMSGDGKVAFTSNGATNSVSVIDVQAGKQLRSITVPARPEAITTNHSGSEIWVGSNDEKVVSVLAAEDASVLAQWAGFEWPYRILLTNDERYAIMPDLGNEQLRFFDVIHMTELGAMDFRGMQPQGVTLYPDDRTLFLSLSGQNKVVAIDIESREIVREYETGSAPDGVAYSRLVLHKVIDFYNQ